MARGQIDNCMRRGGGKPDLSDKEVSRSGGMLWDEQFGQLRTESGQHALFLLIGEGWSGLIQGCAECILGLSPGLLLPHPHSAAVGRGRQQGPVEVSVAHDTIKR